MARKANNPPAAPSTGRIILRWTYFFLMLLLTGSGAYLLLSDYGRAAPRSSFGFVADNTRMQILAGLLRDYERRHGRYPSNQEGLAVLEGFDVRLKTTVPARHGYVEDWEQLAMVLRSIHEGKLPASAATSGLTGSGRTSEQVEVDVALADGQMFVINSAGINSHYRLPYVYENRQENEDAFADPPPDTQGGWAVMVDEGTVYLWSVGARVEQEEIQKRTARYYREAIPRVIVGIVNVLLAVGILVVFIWRKHVRWPGIGFALALFAGGFAARGMTTTCYAISIPRWSDPTPEMVSRQKALLAEFRDKGVISAQTYQRSIAAVDGTPASGPTAASQAAGQ